MLLLITLLLLTLLLLARFLSFVTLHPFQLGSLYLFLEQQIELLHSCGTSSVGLSDQARCALAAGMFTNGEFETRQALVQDRIRP